MKHSGIIHFLAFILAFSMVSEMTTCFQVDAVSIEIDVDSEEEENKEDKLKEYKIENLLGHGINDRSNDSNISYLYKNWITPVIDSITPPPELS